MEQKRPNCNQLALSKLNRKPTLEERRRDSGGLNIVAGSLRFSISRDMRVVATLEVVVVPVNVHRMSGQRRLSWCSRIGNGDTDTLESRLHWEYLGFRGLINPRVMTHSGELFVWHKIDCT